VEVVGRASWSHDFARWGSTRGDAVFTGRLRDGVWGEIALFPLGMIEDDRRGAPDPEIYAAAQRFTPLIGRVRGLAVGLDRDRKMSVRRSDDARVDPVNTVRDVLDRLSRGTETAFVRWDDAAGAVVLVRDREVGKARSGLSADVVFPGGGLAPSRWVVHLERPYRHDLLGLARVTALDVVLEVAPDGSPRAESLATTLDLAGVRITARQRLVYSSVAPCLTAPGGSPPRAPASGSPPP
jgi:hypothetical protein